MKTPQQIAREALDIRASTLGEEWRVFHDALLAIAAIPEKL